MMVYCSHNRLFPLPHFIYNQNKERTSIYYSGFFTKLHNAIYNTWICKNICSTLCSTTVTTQILSAPNNVVDSLKNEIIY